MTHAAKGLPPQAVNTHELNTFLLDFATTLLGVGSQPSRVLRSAQRIGESFGHDVDMVIMPKHVIMTIFPRSEPAALHTSVRIINPAPFNFDGILRLNALSWQALDHNLPLEELRRRYAEVLADPPYPAWLVLLLASCANAAFCRLFGGDAMAMGIVFTATLAAFFTRQRMARLHMDYRIVVMAAAFLASMLAAAAVRIVPTATPEVALGTSVLFLIPGVPLINAVNDIIEGFILMGIARAIHSLILVICITLGLSATLLLMGVDMV